MRKLRPIIWRRLGRSASGAEIAETAMILPLLFVVIMAIFWFGQAFRYYGTITHAARQGARAAVAPACATCTAASMTVMVQNATNAVNNALSAANLDPTQALAPVPPPTLCSCGSAYPCGSALTCQNASGSNVCVQPNVQLSYPSQGGAGTCGTSVSFGYKYPFHFTLPCYPQPCTSLDLNKITLPAQAEMRWRHSHSPPPTGDSTFSRTITDHQRPTEARRSRSQITEFALSLPLLVLFVVGIFDFSSAVTLKQKLTNAARDAARVAAADPANDLIGGTTPVPASVIDAFYVVDNYLISEKINECGLKTAEPTPAGVPATGCPQRSHFLL